MTMFRNMGPCKKCERLFKNLYVWVCAATGIRVESFEKNRFVFFHADGRVIQHAEKAVDKELCSDSEVLLISLAGAALIIGGFPRPEFRRSLEEASCKLGVGTDLLFVTDPSCTFYLGNASGQWDNGDYYAETISRIASRYKKVFVIGSSMGATGILHLFGRFNCSTAVLYNPIVDVRKDDRLLHKIGGNRIPTRLRNSIPDMIAQQLKSNCKLIVHTSTLNEHDVIQRQIFEEMLPACRTRSIAQYMEEESKQPSLVTLDLNPEERYEIVEHASAEHVLPRELAGRQEWLPLLKLDVSKAVNKV